MRTPLLILSLIVLVPNWTGAGRLGLLGTDTAIKTIPVPLDPTDPNRKTAGRLTYLGGVQLKSRDPVFGGFSSMLVDGDRFTLLSDGGNIVRFRMGADWQLRDVRFAELPDGPGAGWQKEDRDSESMIVDPANGDILVGFEGANAIWRYDADFKIVRRHAAPPVMAKWDDNGGAEAMVRLRDGSVVVFSETTKPPKGGGRRAVRFAGDPTLQPKRGIAFVYLPPSGYDPSDAALLPDGRILVLNRHLALPFAFSAKLVIIDPAAIRSGARIAGQEIATLAPPMNTDNFEGVAVTREGDDTILWIVSDDNQFVLERSLLMKFRLEPEATQKR